MVFCILRDRILTLSSRRPLVVTLDQFDPTTADFLSTDDVWDGDTDFFSISMRTVLYQVLISQCRFASILTPSVMSTENSPDLLGPHVCVEKKKSLMTDAYSRLSFWQAEFERLLRNKEANENLAAAVNIHITSLFHIAARLALVNRFALLFLSECCCTPFLPRMSESVGRAQYLQCLLDIVSKTNEEIRWFATNKVYYVLLVSSRCIILIQHALNLFWLHGDNLDEDISQPRDPIGLYMQLDKHFSSQYGLDPLSQNIRHAVRLTMAVYDASTGASGEDYLNTFVQSSGKFDLGVLSPAKTIRLVNICLRLTFIIDYEFPIGEYRHLKFDTLSTFICRLDVRRQPNYCSVTLDSLSSSSAVVPVGLRTRDSESLYSTQSSGDTPSSLGESQHPHNVLSPQVSLPVPTSSFTDSAPCDRGDDGGASSLERFSTATEMSQPSMQEWAGELEEFMAPLFGL
ncbi:hypothetical protein BDW62DRAFT_165859 [Aspergillus aurantiobrunneus]